jgi:pyridoxal phosphate enzyme (YggS family)
MTSASFDAVASHPVVETDASRPWRDVLLRIARAAVSADRSPDDVTLVAVSKQQPWDHIAPVLEAGQRVFGENRVQEAHGRWSAIKSGDTGPQLELRLIGPLQTNKAADAVALFDVIETVDRDRLAKALADAIQSVGRSPRLYVQVNTGEEPQKAGVVPTDADAFIARLRGDYGLSPEGLMCIPPVGEAAGPHFALLAKIAARNGLDRLSMGMSADFETAIRFGATSVRVGSAVFGARDPRP